MNMDKLSEKEIILLLHSVLYAIQDSMNETDRRIFLFISKRLPDIMGKFGFSIDKSKSIEEHVHSFLNLLEDSGYIEDVEFKKEDEKSFRLKIGKCLLEDVGGVHDILRPKKAYCPYSLIVGSIIQELVENRVVVHPSIFRENGVIADIRIYRHAHA